MKIGAIILAAGLSSRMGQNKMLMPFNGEAMLLHAVKACAAAGLEKPIISIGHQAAEVSVVLIGVNYQPVLVEDYKFGIAHSLRAAVKHIPADWDACFVCLGDMPDVSATLLRELAISAKSDRIMVPTYNGKSGNPVLWGRNYFPELINLSGDSGGRQLFKRLFDAITFVDVPDEAVLRDFDTPSDIESAAHKS